MSEQAWAEVEEARSEMRVAGLILAEAVVEGAWDRHDKDRYVRARADFAAALTAWQTAKNLSGTATREGTTTT